jgi:hypothetical protein
MSIPSDLKPLFDAELAAIPAYLEAAFKASDNPILSLAKREPRVIHGGTSSFFRRRLEGPPICLDDWRNQAKREHQSARIREIITDNYLYLLKAKYLDHVRRTTYVTQPEQLQIPNGAVLVEEIHAPLYYLERHDRKPIEQFVEVSPDQIDLNPALDDAKFVDHLYVAEGWLTDTFPDDAPFGDWSLQELPHGNYGPDVTWGVFRGDLYSSSYVDFSKVARLRLPIQS